MTSNGSVEEFILITNDEYFFMKIQSQKNSKRMDCRENQKQQILAQVRASLECSSPLEKSVKRSGARQLTRSNR